MTGMRRLYYLGPEGTFTHQAALEASRLLAGTGAAGDVVLEPCADAASIVRAVGEGSGWGVVAWENNVEGYVVPNLDMLIDARDVAGFARVGVDVTFCAFVTQATHRQAMASRRDGESELDAVCRVCASAAAHPHGLAQCRRFTQAHRLREVPAASNAAACRDLADGRIAFGPEICGRLYGLRRVARHVEDFQGARTEFLVIARRADARAELESACARGVAEFESILTFIPLATGPGVLADALDAIRDAGLNMTSFISRPIKGHDGTYSFIATLDAAPWEPRFRALLAEIIEHGDWIKTLAVYPRRERPHPPVDEWMLPQGGVRCTMEANGASSASRSDGATMRKELLW